jgi:hypothetical protein
VFCKKLGNFKNKPAGVLKIFYDQMSTLPSSDDITRFDGSEICIFYVTKIYTSQLIKVYICILWKNKNENSGTVVNPTPFNPARAARQMVS